MNGSRVVNGHFCDSITVLGLSDNELKLCQFHLY